MVKGIVTALVLASEWYLAKIKLLILDLSWSCLRS